MARRVEVEIVGDAASLRRAFGDSERAGKSFGASLGKVTKYAGLAAGAAGIGALIGTLKVGIDEFTEATKVTAQTNAVLKSTGGIANVSAKEVDSLATAIMNKSGMDDEAIKSGENLLLTFTNIRNEQGKGNDIFNQTTSIMADLSTAMGQDTKTSAIQLGKALNDPATGMTKLSRVGVTFTDQQKELAKHLVATGHTMDAQKIILGELTKEFGGSAEAAGKTLPGQLNILKETFSNVAGDIVAKFVPALQAIVGWVTDNWPTIQMVIEKVFDGIAWAWDNILKPTIDYIIVGVKYVVDYVKENWPKIKETAISVFNDLKGVVTGAIDVIQALWAKFGDNIKTAVRDTWDYVKGYFKSAFEILRGIVKIVGGLLHGDFGKVWDGIKELVGGIMNQIKNQFEAVLNAMVNVVNAIAKAIWAAFKALLDGIGRVIVAAADTVRGWGASLAGWIRDGLMAALHFGAWIGEKIAAIGKGIGSAIGDALGTIKGWGEKLAGFIAEPFKLALDFGAWIGHAIVAGWEFIKGKIIWLKNKIVGLIEDIFGISSPSKVFAELGGHLMSGLAKGIVDMAGDPIEAIKWIFKMVGIEIPDWVTWPAKLVAAPVKLLEWLSSKSDVLGGVLKNVISAATSGIPASVWQSKLIADWRDKGANQGEVSVLAKAIDIGNHRWPYAVGGGHNSDFAPSRGAPHWGMSGSRVGYCCSGSVSAIMHAGGFLDSPMSSGGFLNWGKPGYGKFITTMAIPGEGSQGHVFAVLGGLGWGTGGNNDGGPGWYEHSRDGYTPRHPWGSQGSAYASGAMTRKPAQSPGRGFNIGSDDPDLRNIQFLPPTSSLASSPAQTRAGLDRTIAAMRGLAIVQGFATGTGYALGGLALVGERGPELMYVPRGARITPHHAATSSTTGGRQYPERIQLVVGRKVIAEVVREELQGIARRNGTAGIK